METNHNSTDTSSTSQFSSINRDHLETEEINKFQLPTADNIETKEVQKIQQISFKIAQVPVTLYVSQADSINVLRDLLVIYNIGDQHIFIGVDTLIHILDAPECILEILSTSTSQQNNVGLNLKYSQVIIAHLSEEWKNIDDYEEKFIRYFSSLLDPKSKSTIIEKFHNLLCNFLVNKVNFELE